MDLCVDMYTFEVPIGLAKNVHLCVGMCVDMCVEMVVDMCVDICGMARHMHGKMGNTHKCGKVPCVLCLVGYL